MFSVSVIAQYTESDCWALALALHRKTGLPVRFFHDKWLGWHHVTLAIDSNRIIDVYGIRTNDEVAAEFDSCGWEDYSEENDIIVEIDEQVPDDADLTELVAHQLMQELDKDIRDAIDCMHDSSHSSRAAYADSSDDDSLVKSGRA